MSGKRIRPIQRFVSTVFAYSTFRARGIFAVLEIPFAGAQNIGGVVRVILLFVTRYNDIAQEKYY